MEVVDWKPDRVVGEPCLRRKPPDEIGANTGPE